MRAESASPTELGCADCGLVVLQLPIARASVLITSLAKANIVLEENGAFSRPSVAHFPYWLKHMGIIGDEATWLKEGAHDVRADGNRSLAAKRGGEHGDALLGEGTGL